MFAQNSVGLLPVPRLLLFWSREVAAIQKMLVSNPSCFRFSLNLLSNSSIIQVNKTKSSDYYVNYKSYRSQIAFTPIRKSNIQNVQNTSIGMIQSHSCGAKRFTNDSNEYKKPEVT